MRDRVDVARQDTVARLEHWRDGLKMTERTLATRLFGIGVGRYPEEYFWRHVVDVKPPTYRYQLDGDRSYLRLGGGALYINQAVEIAPITQYRLGVEIRSNDGKRRNLSVDLCSKWLLYSQDCQAITFETTRNDAGWERFDAKLLSGAVGGGGIRWSRTPVKLSLSNPAPNTEIDIRQVSLIDSEGRQLLKNGDFAEGGDHWLFTIDNPWPWHTENIAVHILVEQGWLGFMCASLLVTLVIRRLFSQFRWRDVNSAALLAALLGALVLGQVDSFFEFPRLTMMFILLCGVALATAKRLQRLDDRRRPRTFVDDRPARVGDPGGESSRISSRSHARNNASFGDSASRGG
jgi:hypothetical protein